jgi:hypothetical protein
VQDRDSVRTEFLDAVAPARFAREQRTEKLFRLELVVRAAAQRQVAGARLPTCRERDHVVEFQEPALGTSPFGPHERALSHQLLHLSFALVADERQQLARVRRCEMRANHSDGRQRHVAGAERLEYTRCAPRETGRRDPFVSAIDRLYCYI